MPRSRPFLTRMIGRILPLALLVCLVGKPADGAQRKKKPFRIESISVEGNTLFTEAELVDALQFVRRGDSYDWEVLDADIRINLLRKYLESGFMAASFAFRHTVTPSSRDQGDPPRVSLHIHIEEGRKLRCSEVLIKGDPQLKRPPVGVVRRALKGQFMDIGKIENSAMLMRRVYDHYGFLDATVTPTWRINRRSDSVVVEFEIQEHFQYVVHRISFVGNSKTRDNELRRHLILQEQRVFNMILLEQSLDRLNRLKLVQWITRGDWKLIKRPREAEVDVVIRVRER